MRKITNWWIDVSESPTANFRSYGETMLGFINFLNSPATCMSVPSHITINGKVIGEDHIIIGNISLVNKVTDEGILQKLVSNSNIGNNLKLITSDGVETTNSELKPIALQIITSSGDEYYLLESEMDVRFRREFISSNKIIHIESLAK